jgi:ribonuclease-3
MPAVGRDNKTELQELAQSVIGEVPRYVHREPSGPDHEKIFTVAVFVGGTPVGEGSGRTKKEAEQAAARAGLEHLKTFTPSGAG